MTGETSIGSSEACSLANWSGLMPGNDLLGFAPYGAHPAGTLKRVPIGILPIGHMGPVVVINRCY